MNKKPYPVMILYTGASISLKKVIYSKLFLLKKYHVAWVAGVPSVFDP
jgi:hypothetical protein